MTFAVAFDFAEKSIRKIHVRDAPAAVASGRYCWIDVDALDAARPVLEALGAEALAIERAMRDQAQSQLHVGRTGLDFTLTEADVRNGALTLRPIHLTLGEGYMVTAHNGGARTIEHMLETYESDFAAAAQSGGFLLFELADYLTQDYRDALAALSTEVDGIQRRLMGDIGDEILSDVSDLTRDLLEFRNAVVAAREIVHELATRRSPFVNESTQPFLDRQTAPLERLANDAATERAVLSESLNLYMGLVSHRTNKVVNRLTLVSMVFLPLNFLAAVYGMNFRHMPELAWPWAYPAFWLAAIAIAIGLFAFMRWRKWF